MGATVLWKERKSCGTGCLDRRSDPPSGSRQPDRTRQGGNNYPGFTFSYPPIAPGAPHWLNPTRSHRALEFIYVIHTGQPLGHRAGRRVGLEEPADLSSTLG